jgi:hypothetical protein
MNATVNTTFIERVAWKTQNLLTQYKAFYYTSGIAFYLWQRVDRIIVAFNPGAIISNRINDNFAHDLSTRLEGRLVVRTNTRGIFLQVGLDTPPRSISLDEALPLDLTQQPSPWHLPVGMTENGPLWIPLMGGTSFLIGGSTGMGKTGEEHAWIQALLHGGKTLVYAWDGKHSVEFIRYADKPNFHLMIQVSELEQLRSMLEERKQKLVDSGSVNILDHNEAHPDDAIPPIALFVDEAADLPDSAKTLLQQMISIYRYLGLYPIIATNQTAQVEMFGKTNLLTRVAFRVPQLNHSMTILGNKGAESLPAICGRGLIIWRGRLVEFQSFMVTYPPISERARQLMADAAEVESDPPAQEEGKSELVKQLHAQGKSNTSIVYEVWGRSGEAFAERMKLVKHILATASTSTASGTPVLPLNGHTGK